MNNRTDLRPLEVIIARETSELDSLRSAWEMLLAQQEFPAFNAEPIRFLSVIGLQKGISPCVMLLRKDEKPVTMLIASIASTQIRCRIGYQRIPLPQLRCFSIVHGGALGQITEETSGVLLTELERLLAASEVDVVFFNHVETESPLYHCAVKRFGHLRSSRYHRTDVHRTMTVPSSMDSFYQSLSKKRRAKLRRYARRIEEHYAGRAQIKQYTSEDSVDSFLRAASRVSSKTYQHGLGIGLEYTDLTRGTLREVAKGDWLQGHVMFIDDEPCAFQSGVLYGKKYFLEQIGFDPKWKDLNVGSVLFLHVLETLCQRDVHEIVMDFGFGDAEYKRSYGTQSWNEATFYVFAPRLQPILVNLVYSGATLLSNGLTRVLEKTGMIRRIKRLWRTYLQERLEEEKSGRDAE